MGLKPAFTTCGLFPPSDDDQYKLANTLEAHFCTAMSSKQGSIRWRRFGKRNSAPDGPIMGVIPNQDLSSRGTSNLSEPKSKRGAFAPSLAKVKGTLRGSFRKAKPFVPTEELTSLTALPPSKSQRNIQLIPADFPSLSNVDESQLLTRQPGQTMSRRASSACTSEYILSRDSQLPGSHQPGQTMARRASSGCSPAQLQRNFSHQTDNPISGSTSSVYSSSDRVPSQGNGGLQPRQTMARRASSGFSSCKQAGFSQQPRKASTGYPSDGVPSEISAGLQSDKTTGRRASTDCSTSEQVPISFSHYQGNPMARRASTGCPSDRAQLRRNSSRGSYVPPTEGPSPTNTSSSSTATRKSSISKSSSSGSRSPADGDFEISVYRKPPSKRLEDHDKEIAQLQKKAREEDKTDTTEGSSQHREQLQQDLFVTHEQTDYGQCTSDNDCGESCDNFNSSMTALMGGTLQPMYTAASDRMLQIEQEKRQRGLIRDRSTNDASWRTSRTGVSHRSYQTDGTRSHVSVRAIDAEADTGGWLPQHARWEESTLDFTTTSELGVEGDEFNWTPSPDDCRIAQTSFVVSSHSRGRSSHSRRSAANDHSSHSAMSSRHSRRDGMPRKPRHSKCSSPSREAEWASKTSIDVPPSESKSGRSGRRSRLSPERVRELEISWSPDGSDPPINERAFSPADKYNDFSPIKPARYWKPPVDSLPANDPLCVSTGDGSHRTFDRMMEQAIRRSHNSVDDLAPE